MVKRGRGGRGSKRKDVEEKKTKKKKKKKKKAKMGERERREKEILQSGLFTHSTAVVMLALFAYIFLSLFLFVSCFR